MIYLINIAQNREMTTLYQAPNITESHLGLEDQALQAVDEVESLPFPVRPA